MGYEILVTLFLLVLAPMVVLGFIVFWTSVSRERAHLEGCWRSYATKRSREYVEARGSWPNRSSPSVRWLEGNLKHQLSVVGVEAGARTRLVVWPRSKLLGSFVVSTRSWSRAFPRLEHARPSHRESTDGIVDSAFESAFTVSSSPRGLAARVLCKESRRALLGFRQRDDVVLTYRRGKLSLEWPGRESNDARLDEAARVMMQLARGVDDAFSHPGSAEAIGPLTEQHAE